MADIFVGGGLPATPPFPLPPPPPRSGSLSGPMPDTLNCLGRGAARDASRSRDDSAGHGRSGPCSESGPCSRPPSSQGRDEVSGPAATRIACPGDSR